MLNNNTITTLPAGASLQLVPQFKIHNSKFIIIKSAQEIVP